MAAIGGSLEQQLLSLLRERDALEVTPFRDVFTTLADAQAQLRGVRVENATMSSELCTLRSERERLTEALRCGEAAAARGAEAEALQVQLTQAQRQLRLSYEACAEASAALLAARELAAAREAKLARLTSDISVTRTDLAHSRERVAELATALERERDVAAAARGELDARLSDKEAAEARLSRLQVEHLDVVQRFMDYQSSESTRMGHIQRLQEELANARAGAASTVASAAAPQPSTPRVSSGDLSAFPCVPVDAPVAVDIPLRRRLGGAPRHTLRANSGATHALAFAQSATLLATAGEDRTIHVWDPASGALLHALRGALGAVLDVCWSGDGEMLLSCGADKVLRLHHLASGRVRHTLTGHTDRVLAVAMDQTDPQAARAFSAGQDRCVKVWDVARGVCVNTLLCTSGVTSLCACDPSHCLATGHSDGAVRFWDARSGDVVHEAAGAHPQAAVTSVVRCAGAGGGGQPHLLLSCCRDGSLRLLDARTHGAMRTLRAAAFKVSAAGGGKAALSCDASLAAAGGADGALCLWDLSRDAGAEHVATLRGHSAAVGAVGWGAQGGCAGPGPLASADRNGVALIWES